MPTYQYRCKACAEELEVVQSFTDDPLTTCEACGGELRKVFAAPGIAFKGSGFYKNDARGSGKSSTTSSESSSSDSSSSSSSSSSDAGTSSSGSGDKAAATTSSTT